MTRAGGSCATVALIAAIAGGCGGGGGASKAPAGGAAHAHHGPNAASSSAALAVTVHKTGAYGPILVDGAGRTLYLFTHDQGARSRCSGACARAWPPTVTAAAPRARGQARAALLATSRRPDGSTQLTYAGHPLYYFLGDRRPGEINCQNADEYGGTWLIVDPKGRAIRHSAPPCPRP